MVRAIPLKTMAAFDVEKAFTRYLAFAYGIPKTVLTDNGKKSYAKFLKKHNIDTRETTTNTYESIENTLKSENSLFPTRREEFGREIYKTVQICTDFRGSFRIITVKKRALVIERPDKTREELSNDRVEPAPPPKDNNNTSMFQLQYSI
eukprot:IDg6371t1